MYIEDGHGGDSVSFTVSIISDICLALEIDIF